MYLIITEEKCGGSVLREKIMFGKPFVAHGLTQQTNDSNVASCMFFLVS